MSLQISLKINSNPFWMRSSRKTGWEFSTALLGRSFLRALFSYELGTTRKFSSLSFKMNPFTYHQIVHVWIFYVPSHLMYRTCPRLCDTPTRAAKVSTKVTNAVRCFNVKRNISLLKNWTSMDRVFAEAFKFYKLINERTSERRLMSFTGFGLRQTYRMQQRVELKNFV